jgi:hypothetical protein
VKGERDIHPPPLTEIRKARLEEARMKIAERLRKICGHLSEREFATLVEKMAHVEVGGDKIF